MFGRILSIAAIALLTVGIVGTGYWGYQEHQDKNSVLIKAENSYQRAFHDLNNNVSNLEDELGKSIAMNTRQLLAPCMTNIWRIAYVAQGNVGQLPLNMMAFSQTEEFLTKIADYTYDIGMRDLEQEPLTDKEWKRLKTLHAQAKEIQGELQKVQTEVLNKNLRWMDVEVAIASENKDMDKTIVNGFKGLETQIEGYIETEMGATENKQSDRFSIMSKIKGPEISEADAKNIVRKFLKINKNVEMNVSKNGEGQHFTTYSVNVNQSGKNGTNVDVSRKGGYVLWFLNSRDIENTKIGLNDAQNRALKFMQEHGITSMVAVESNQYDNVGVFDFVTKKNGVRIYPELVTVKVALDNGEIIGYQASDYVMNQEEGTHIPKPTISLAEAKAKVNKNLKVLEDHLSMVEVKKDEVKLCYELLGTIGNETYRIFINAETGDEEKIEKMKQAQPLT